jgi:intein/homing endonuclease
MDSKFSEDDILLEIERQDRRRVAATGSDIDQIVQRVTEESLEEEEVVVDIIEYIRAEWGLNENPYPIQRFILKVIFGIPLDDRPDDLITEVISPTQFKCFRPDQFRRVKYLDIGENRAVKVRKVNLLKKIVILEEEPYFPLLAGDAVTGRIEVWDKFRENIIGTYDESEFFDFLYGDGPGAENCRISLSREEYERNLGRQMNLVVFRLGRRGTKCVCEHTLCHTSDGLLSLKELSVDKGFVVPDGDGGYYSSDQSFDNGIQETIRITTSLGTQLEGTGEHRVWVMGEDGNVDWKYLKDVGYGDVICHSRLNGDCGFGEVKPYSITLFELWGLYVGDGVVTESHPWQILYECEGVEERFLVEHLIRKEFGVDPEWVPDKRVIPHLGRVVNAGALKIHGNGKGRSPVGSIRHQWLELGFGWDVKETGVPLIVRTASKEQQAAFLRGLFEADGSASHKRVCLFAKHRKLVSDVQLMLMSFGIISRIDFQEYGNEGGYFLSVKYNRDRELFRDEIGFISDRKNRDCDKSCQCKEIDAIPNQWTWVKQWYEDLGCLLGNKSRFRRDFQYPIESGELTITRLEKLLAKYPQSTKSRDHLQELYTRNYCYSEVVEIERGTAYTRDLSVPDSHRYIAGGMITHNTSLAQWVAAYFCYRVLKKYHPQEYYQTRRDQPITISLIATTKVQAQDLLAPARATIKRSPYLRRFVTNDDVRRIDLNTPYNIDHGLDSESGIKVKAEPCSARATRGPAIMLGLLEEFGLFMSHIKDSNSSDKEIYTAIAPGISDLKNPETDEPEGLMIIVSTPLTTESYMYEVEQGIWDGDSELSNSLALHIPSPWVNPLLSSKALRTFHAVDPAGYEQEYEARYSDQYRKAFTREVIERCRKDPGDHQWLLPGEDVFCGFDLGGLKAGNDRTTISLIAMNAEGLGRLILHEVIGYGLPGYEDYLDETREELDLLSIKKIAKHIDELWVRWNVRKGLGDQWNAYGVTPNLTSQAHDGLELVNMTAAFNDMVARNFVAYIEQAQFTIFAPFEDWKIDDSLIRELCRLDRKETGGSVKKIALRCPETEGQHDDQYSSVSRALFVAQQEIVQQPPNITSRTSTAATSTIRDRAEMARQRAEVLVRTQRGHPLIPRGGRR